MSEKIRKAIRERVVDPALNEQGKDEVGKVTKLRYKNEEGELYNMPLVDVMVLDSGGNAKRTFREIPILGNALNSSVDGAKLKVGDKVLVSFYRNNSRFPYVAGRLFHPDEFQKEMKTEEGAYKSDAYGYF